MLLGVRRTALTALHQAPDNVDGLLRAFRLVPAAGDAIAAGEIECYREELGRLLAKPLDNAVTAHMRAVRGEFDAVDDACAAALRVEIDKVGSMSAEAESAAGKSRALTQALKGAKSEMDRIAALMRRRDERVAVGAPADLPERPSEHLCPISRGVMVDPVSGRDGVPYEREEINKWLTKSKKKTSPVTNQPLYTEDLVPNFALKALIRDWPERVHARLVAAAQQEQQKLQTAARQQSRAQIADWLSEAAGMRERKAGEVALVLVEQYRATTPADVVAVVEKAGVGWESTSMHKSIDQILRMKIKQAVEEKLQPPRVRKTASGPARVAQTSKRKAAAPEAGGTPSKRAKDENEDLRMMIADRADSLPECMNDASSSEKMKG